MSNQPAHAIADTTAPEPAVGVIETDAFCDGCGFNLHSQKVWRDARLGIAVCRCPECGRHASAGIRTTAQSTWLRRLAVAGMAAWLVFQLAFVTGLFFGVMGVQGLSNEAFVTSRYETRAGEPVESNYDSTTVTSRFVLEADQNKVVPTQDVVFRSRLLPWLGGPMPVTPSPYSRPITPPQTLFMGGLIGAPWFVASAFLATISWHWRRVRMWIWLALPVASTIAVMSLMIAQRSSHYTAAGDTPREETGAEEIVLLGVLVILMIVMGIGLSLGRRMARLALLVFVSPKARQLFSFLWHCDGLTMPVASSISFKVAA